MNESPPPSHLVDRSTTTSVPGYTMIPNSILRLLMAWILFHQG